MGHGHQHFHQMMARQVAGRDLTTINGQVVSVVYVTETPTFDGVIGGFSTITDGGDVAQPTAAASAAASNAGAASADNQSIPEAATATGPPSISQSASASTRSTANGSNTAVAGPAITSSSGSSSDSSSISSSGEEGMSTGAKAGLAIGIIAGIGLIAALLLFIIGKKKKQRKEQESRAGEDEKKTFGASRNAIGLQSSPSFTSGPAPRLSIRPMSKNLLGDFGFGGTNRRSAGNMLNTISEQPARNPSPAPQSRAQTPPENPFADPQNPFADPEKAMAASGAAPAVARGPDSQNAPPPPGAGPRSLGPMAPPVAPNPDRIAFTGSWPAAPAGYDSGKEAPRGMSESSHQHMPSSARGPVPEPDDLPIMGAPTPQIPMPSPAPSSSIGGAGGMAAAGAAAAIAGAAVASASNKKQERHPEPSWPGPQQEEPRQKPVERREVPREAPREAMSSPGPAPSPAFTAGASDAPSPPAPSTGSGSTAGQAGGNVYRVLMDFVPSMEDELELKSGQLVRLLHEYDDGWALCIKLDRSHQGVVPRTCLAAKPSKPKPSHLGQYARNGPQGRPMSPAGDPRGRPMSPAGGRNSPAMNRPMSPGMGRPMSPGMGRPMSPAGGPMRPVSSGGRQMRPMSPAGGRGPGPYRGPPGGPGPNRPMSPGGFNQAPRPLSPGPLRGSAKRSQSPGPYGAAGPLPMPSAPMRRRSNSASNFQDRRMSPPGPSKLGPGQGMRPLSPAGMGMAI